MQIIHLNSVPSGDQSPKGKYHAFMKEVSVALGREPDSSTCGRHPSICNVRVPSGASPCPYHAHSAQWELYLIVAGRGACGMKEVSTEVCAGDAFFLVRVKLTKSQTRAQQTLSIM